MAALEIINSVSTALYLTNPILSLLTALKHIDLSIAHGNTPASTFAYTSHGLVLCGMVGDIEAGYQFGHLGLKLLAQQENARNFHRI